jgi:hypothetical protein
MTQYLLRVEQNYGVDFCDQNIITRMWSYSKLVVFVGCVIKSNDRMPGNKQPGRIRKKQLRYNNNFLVRAV